MYPKFAWTHLEMLFLIRIAKNVYTSCSGINIAMFVFLSSFVQNWAQFGEKVLFPEVSNFKGGGGDFQMKLTISKLTNVRKLLLFFCTLYNKDGYCSLDVRQDYSIVPRPKYILAIPQNALTTKMGNINLYRIIFQRDLS